jgi:hypothetical protein
MYEAKLFAAELAADNKGSGVKIPVGIHSDGSVVFNGITTETTWYDINFSNKSGRTLHKRLFTPTGASPLGNETIQDAKTREESRNISYIVQLMTELLSPEIVEAFSAVDYKSFVTSAAALLNQQKGTQVNLKVVPDYKEQKYPDTMSSKYGTYVEKHKVGIPTKLAFTQKELEAVAAMEGKRAASQNVGSAMSSEDLTSLV